MDKFSVDLTSLEQDVTKKKAFRLDDVRDKIEKVAFDVVRFKETKDKSIAGLWQIQPGDDGDVIVAMYEDKDDEQLEATSSWSAVSDRSGNNVNIFYKTTPVAKVATASLGVPDGDVNLLCRYLPESLSENKKLVAALLKDLSEDQVKKLADEHPEMIEGVEY